MPVRETGFSTNGGEACRAPARQCIRRTMAGPPAGLTIVEMAGLGPGPFAAMMLADHGASVVRIERAGMIGIADDPLLRSRRSISLDLKQDKAREVVRQLAARADGLIEGY